MMTERESPSPSDGRPSVLLGLTRGELAQRLEPMIDHGYRVEQIYRALYQQGVADLDEMTVLGKSLRRELGSSFRVGLPVVADRRVSRDGTTKFLFRLDDDVTVEAVDIPTGPRRTLCLSSQAGCPLGCRFCVTGYWGAGRDLTAGEIVGQVLAMTGGLDLQQSLNIVYMGMGEPLLNLAEVRRSLELLSEWISWRRITVSTVGMVPGIDAMAEWKDRPNLAVSLHCPDDERRGRLMPINATYPLQDLFDALERYPLEKGRQLTFEYLLVAGFNDRLADADLLAERIGSLSGKVNLIPVNPDPVLSDNLVPPSEAVVEGFRRRLLLRGVFASVRLRRGDQVSAACGQLRAPGRSPRRFRRSDLSF